MPAAVLTQRLPASQHAGSRPELPEATRVQRPEPLRVTLSPLATLPDAPGAPAKLEYASDPAATPR